MPGLREIRSIVTPENWLSMTSLAMKRRSPKLVSLDNAYKNFYNFDATTTDHKMAESLLIALHDFLSAKGGDWAKVSRNTASGGYMQQLYDDLKVALRTGHPRVKNIVEATDAEKAQQRIKDYDIPHSRLGVLYLLGSIEVNFDIAGAVLGGTAALGSIGALGGTTEFGGVHADVVTGAHAPISASHLQGTPMHVGDIGSHHVSTSPVISGGTGAIRFGKGLATGSGTASHTGHFSKFHTPTRGAIHFGPRAPLAPGIDPKSLPPSTRPLTLPPMTMPVGPTFDTPMGGGGVTFHADPSDRSTLEAIRSGVSGLSDDVLAGWESFKGGLGELPDDVRAGWRSLSAGVANLPSNLRATWASLKRSVAAALEAAARKVEVFLHLKPHEKAGIIGKLLKAVFATALQHILTSALPFVKAGIDAATGVLRTIDACMEKVKAWWARRQIIIMEGHPSAIASAIETQMEWGIGQGLLDFLKGGISLGAQFILPGVGSLVSAVSAGIEWLVKLYLRITEGKRLEVFLEKARYVYEVVREDHKIVEGDAGIQLELDESKKASSIVYNTEEFTKFFKEGCDASVIVPMLTINSGICGSMMTFMRLIKDNGDIISDTTFGTGVGYTSRLKSWGARYLRASGFKFEGRHKDDMFIKNLLGHAVHDHERLATLASKTWAGMRA